VEPSKLEHHIGRVPEHCGNAPAMVTEMEAPPFKHMLAKTLQASANATLIMRQGTYIIVS